MSINLMDDFTFKHSGQLDAIYTQYTAQQIKALFDSRGDELRTALNLLITTLKSTEGAADIGTSTIQDVDGVNIQAMLQSIRDKLKSKVDGLSGADYINATSISGLTGETVQSLLESLKAYADGLTASDIEATPIASGSGTTVQSQLAWLLSQIAIAATGSIPANSIDETKLVTALVDKINTALSNTGVLTTLITTDKSSAVNAINENSLSIATNATNITTVNNNLMSHSADDMIHIYYAVATGSANTYAVTLNPAPTSYVDGMAICVKINVASTGASTLNVNGLGAKTILDSLGNAITSGGLKANTPYTMRYNGTSFIVQGKGGGGNATAAQLLNGQTATVDSGLITGTMPNKVGSNTVYTVSTSDQAIGQGYYGGAATDGKVKGEANLLASNIKNGVTIGAVTGNLTISSLGGKNYATGSVTSSAGVQSYTYVDGTGVGTYTVVVSGLTFKPSLIHLKYNNGSYDWVTTYEEVSGGLYPKTAKLGRYNLNTVSAASQHFKGDVAPASVTSSGFTLPVLYASVSFNWVAYE